MAERKLADIRRDLREAPESELMQELQRAKDNLFSFRYQAATNQLENVMRIREERKQIARILTILRERELKGEGQ